MLCGAGQQKSATQESVRLLITEGQAVAHVQNKLNTLFLSQRWENETVASFSTGSVCCATGTSEMNNLKTINTETDKT